MRVAGLFWMVVLVPPTSMSGPTQVVTGRAIKAVMHCFNASLGFKFMDLISLQNVLRAMICWPPWVRTPRVRRVF